MSYSGNTEIDVGTYSGYTIRLDKGNAAPITSGSNVTISNDLGYFKLKGSNTKRIEFITNYANSTGLANITIFQDANCKIQNNITFRNVKNTKLKILFDECTFSSNANVYSSTDSLEPVLTLINCIATFKGKNYLNNNPANVVAGTSVNVWGSTPNILNTVSTTSDIIGYPAPIELKNSAIPLYQQVDNNKHGDIIIKCPIPAPIYFNDVDSLYIYDFNVTRATTDTYQLIGLVENDMTITNDGATANINIDSSTFQNRLYLNIDDANANINFTNSAFITENYERAAIFVGGNCSANINFDRSDVFLNSNIAENYFIDTSKNNSVNISGKVSVALVYNDTLNFYDETNPIPSIFQDAYYYLGYSKDIDRSTRYGGSYTLINFQDTASDPRFYPLTAQLVAGTSPTNAPSTIALQNVDQYFTLDYNQSNVNLNLGNAMASVNSGIYILDIPQDYTVYLQANVFESNANKRCITFTGSGNVDISYLSLDPSAGNTFINKDANVTINLENNVEYNLEASNIAVTFNAYDEYEGVFSTGANLKTTGTYTILNIASTEDDLNRQ